MAHLTRWGWVLSSNACVELGKNWGYCLPLGDYTTRAIASNCGVVGTFQNGMCQLASNYPTVFKLSVLDDRDFPATIPNDFYCTNSGGAFVTNSSGTKFVCPEAPTSYLLTAQAYWSNSLYMVMTNAPITVFLNGGEYGMDVAGGAKRTGGANPGDAWIQDPRVQAVTNAYPSQISYSTYSSTRKSNEVSFLSSTVRSLIPNRELYIFYTDRVNEQLLDTTFADWWGGVNNWGWKSDIFMPNFDLPWFVTYWGTYNTWLDAAIPHLHSHLSDLLAGVGYELGLGYTTNYPWLNGGYSATDPSAFCSITNYYGYLKCSYTAGAIGGVAGYFSYPGGTNYGYLVGGPGFDAYMPADQPPHWLQQLVALSRVHAQFSWLENYVRSGDLLPGPTHHRLISAQWSYEFTNTVADISKHVLARKVTGQNQWLITAWSAVTTNANVTVNIPTLGDVTVNARPEGSVYTATPGPTLTLTDPNGMLPTELTSVMNVGTLKLSP